MLTCSGISVFFQ